MIDAKGFREDMDLLLAGIRNATHQALVIAKDEIVKHAKSTTLWKDSTAENRGSRRQSRGTRNSIHGEVFGMGGWVEAGGAAYWLENGTKPHTISARGGYAFNLRFQMNGQIIYRKSVKHPGTAPTHFMEQARDHGEQVLDYGLDYLVGQAIERMNAKK